MKALTKALVVRKIKQTINENMDDKPRFLRNLFFSVYKIFRLALLTHIDIKYVLYVENIFIVCMKQTKVVDNVRRFIIGLQK